MAHFVKVGPRWNVRYINLDNVAAIESWEDYENDNAHGLDVVTLVKGHDGYPYTMRLDAEEAEDLIAAMVYVDGAKMRKDAQ